MRLLVSNAREALELAHAIQPASKGCLHGGLERLVLLDVVVPLELEVPRFVKGFRSLDSRVRECVVGWKLFP